MVPLLEEAVQAPRTQRSVEAEGRDEVEALGDALGIWGTRGRWRGGEDLERGGERLREGEG